MTDLPIPRPDPSELDDLVEWVDWLVGHYHLNPSRVVVCWATHSQLQEEFAALHRSWLAAYAHDAHPDAALRWHEAFAEAEHRLRNWTAIIGCHPGVHNEPRHRL